MRGLEFLSIRWRAIILVIIIIVALWAKDAVNYITNPAVEEDNICVQLQLEVGSHIRKANYCEKDSDCTEAILPCPFGCGEYGGYINKQEEEDILAEVREYQEQCGVCVQDCYLPPVKLHCVEGQCQPDN